MNYFLKHRIKKKKKKKKGDSKQHFTMKGKSQEMPLPLCLAATVVGPARDGIQKKASARSPYKNHFT